MIMHEEDENIVDEEISVTNFTELKNYIKDEIIIKGYRDTLNYFKEKKQSLKKCFRIKNDINSGLLKILSAYISPKKLFFYFFSEPIELQNNFSSEVNSIKPSALQKTRLYIQAQKQINRSSIIPDSLEYYLKQLTKLNQKKINFEFINELLDRGVDINYLSKSNENALFEVCEFKTFGFK